jgi:uncharacterized protein HemX
MERIFIAAADVPTGIPTGLPPGVAEAAVKLANSDGIFGPIVVLLGVAIAAMWWEMRRQKMKAEADREATQKAHDEDRDEWQRQLQGERDKRVDELRNVITALNNSTATMSVFAQTQADRTSTIQELANKQDRVSLVASNNAQMLDRNLAEYRAGIEQLSTLVRNLVGGQRASNNGGG